MTYKVLLDTNVLVDAALAQRPESAEANRLLDGLARGQVLGCVSALSLKDFYYICRKGLSDTVTRSWLRGIVSLCEVIPVDRESCLRALSLDNPDFEDALIEIAVADSKADYLVSRDLEGFAGLTVPRVSAAEFLEIAGAEG